MFSKREISLLSVVGECVGHWRNILVCMIIGVLLGGVYGLMRNQSSGPVVPALPEEEKLKLQSLYGEELDYEKRRSDLLNLPILYMQSEEVYYGSLCYQTDFPQTTKNIFEDAVYYSAETINFESLNSIVCIETGEGEAEIRCLAPDMETCTNLLDEIERKIKKEKDEYEIAINLLYKKVSLGKSKNVSEIIESKREELDVLKEELTFQKSVLTAKETEYYTALKNGTDFSCEENTLVKNTPKLNYKMCILGCIAGAFIGFCIWALKYVFNGFVKVEDDLSVLKIDEIDTIIGKQKKKGFLDGIALKMRSHVSRISQDPDEKIRNISIQISAMLGKRAHKKVGVWIWTKTEYGNSIAEKLVESMKIQLIDCVVERSEISTNDALREILNVDNCILVIEDRTVSYCDFEKTVKLLNRQNIALIGTVKII